MQQSIRATLDEQHYKFPDYKQRMPAATWRKFLLENEDTIIFRGRVRRLVAENLGYGVVEVSKEIPHD